MFLCSSCTIFCAVRTLYDYFFTVSAWLWLDLHYAMLEFIFRVLSNSLLQVSAMEKEWIRPKIPKLYHISCKTLAVKAGIYKFEISIFVDGNRTPLLSTIYDVLVLDYIAWTIGHIIYIDIYYCIYRIDTCIYHKMRFALLSLMEYINKLGMEYNCWTMNCFMRTWKKFFLANAIGSFSRRTNHTPIQ